MSAVTTAVAPPSRVRTRGRACDVALAHAALVLAVFAGLRFLPVADRAGPSLAASTTSRTWPRTPCVSLLLSAVVVPTGPGLLSWVPRARPGAGAQRRFVRVATIGVFAVGHGGRRASWRGSSLAGLRLGWVDASVRGAVDVGVSYGLACVAGLLVASGPRRWRAAGVAGSVAVALAALPRRPGLHGRRAPRRAGSRVRPGPAVPAGSRDEASARDGRSPVRRKEEPVRHRRAVVTAVVGLAGACSSAALPGRPWRTPRRFPGVPVTAVADLRPSADSSAQFVVPLLYVVPRRAGRSPGSESGGDVLTPGTVQVPRQHPRPALAPRAEFARLSLDPLPPCPAGPGRGKLAAWWNPRTARSCSSSSASTPPRRTDPSTCGAAPCRRRPERRHRL